MRQALFILVDDLCRDLDGRSTPPLVLLHHLVVFNIIGHNVLLNHLQGFGLTFYNGSVPILKCSSSQWSWWRNTWIYGSSKVESRSSESISFNIHMKPQEEVICQFWRRYHFFMLLTINYTFSNWAEPVMLQNTLTQRQWESGWGETRSY